MSFAIFNEQFYLANNADVKAAVEAGNFSSGREHFELHGLQEGRVLVSPFYDEAAYLRKYPDVAEAVAAKTLPSGLTQYIQHGEAEGRSGTAFNEEIYLMTYPDVADAVVAETFSSGLDHFTQTGQFEERAAFFSGTSGNDMITAFGYATIITGVGLYEIDSSFGAAGIDTLTGGGGLDLFLLGDYYVGGGSADFAMIQNFDKSDFDLLAFSGLQEDYNFQVVNESTNIVTSSGDLVATVQGVTDLNVLIADPLLEIFIVS